MSKYRNYIDGSAARQLVAPERDYRDYREKEQPQIKERTVPVRRKKTSLLSVIMLLAAIMGSLYLCVEYVRVYSDITAMNKEIVALQSDIKELEELNADAYSNIDASVDLRKVYKKATKELGMVPADKNQVYTYDNKKSDRVIQYSTIPE